MIGDDPLEEPETPSPNATDTLMRMTTDIVAAYLGNNQLPTAEIPGLVANIHATLLALSEASGGPQKSQRGPAVPISESVTPDHIICLEDGKELKMLKRYLRTHYDMSPSDYREKWDLPLDYPMVAPNYAAKRSEYAKQIGLGQSGRGSTPGKIKTAS